MPFDFSLSPRLVQWRDRVRQFGRIYADVRAFRIYDGASEVHRMSIAKRATRRARADG